MSRRSSSTVITPLEPRQSGPDLSFIPDAPQAVSADVRALAAQIHAASGEITAAAQSQLLDYFDAGVRIAELQVMKLNSQEPAFTARLLGQIDKVALVRRTLLRDLGLTRSATAGGSAATKAAQRSGSKWQGIL